MTDSPAYRSHLRVGDRVLAVNDVSIDDLSHEKIVECIRKSGQRLRLLLLGCKFYFRIFLVQILEKNLSKFWKN